MLSMLSSVANLAITVGSLPQKVAVAGGVVGIKSIKYFIDDTFRDKVAPVPGSVVYCDLWVAVEHSGIYVGNGNISNIEVDGFADSSVCRSTPRNFTAKSWLGSKIYVSCDKDGPVGSAKVAQGADEHVGERRFYGLVFKNCHVFSTQCVNYADGRAGGVNGRGGVASLSLEPTLLLLKKTAADKLGATKWRLWDWDDDGDHEPSPEPDWQALNAYYENLPLNAQSIEQIREELEATQDYEMEIADENIPQQIRQRLSDYRQTLAKVSQKYDEVKGFLASCPDARFSYSELKACNDDFSALARELQNNPRIKELAHKMGRSYISEEKKRQAKVQHASKSEVHGTHRSDDLMRVLPSELLNLEDEALETLFYARLLEKNLLSYELQGVTFISGEETETNKKRTGPVVACLDTSGSMRGTPLLKAKALLLAIANILKKENRSLHVLLFGATGEIREFSMMEQNNAAGLLEFLQQSFDGGTDYETPLNHAFQLIGSQRDYKKADVLMISDGDCQLSSSFTQTVKAKKEILNCSIYSILCAGNRTEAEFSDEVLVL